MLTESSAAPSRALPEVEDRVPAFELRRCWPWFAAVLSGVLLALCHPPFDQGWLCWIALIPLICAVFFAPPATRRPGLKRAALGYVAGLFFFAIAFGWLRSLGTLYQSPWLYLLPLLVAFYMAFYVAFWAWFLGLLGRDRQFSRASSNLGIAAAGAAAWVTHEWVRGWLFSGWGWNELGVALHRDLPMIQIAEFTGVPGLSFLVCFVNLMAVIIVRRIRCELGPRFLTRIRWEFSVTMAMIVAVFSFGMRVLLRNLSGLPSLRVVAIQPNIPQVEKFDPASEEHVFSELEKLTSLAALSQPPPQLLLWPEAATPRSMFADDVSYRFVIDQAKRGDFALLIGTLDFDPARGEEYNVAAFLTERGARHEIHRKMHLVPFGEYLPLRPFFGLFAGGLVPRDYSFGTDFTVLQLPSPAVKISPLICFEDTLGDLTRRFVLRGAELLVNITNDGWFLQTAACEQHLANAVFRTVENRRPMVRCANTGVTCSIDRTGRVTRALEPFVQGFAPLGVEIRHGEPLTFYTRYGEWFPIGATVVTILVVLSRAVRRKASSTA